jgi:sugar (pentulose or hexulose) kinase
MTIDKTAYLGIDVGTQGLSCVLVDSTNPSTVFAVAEGNYDFSSSKEEQQTSGHYEQCPDDWLRALKDALQQLRTENGIILVGGSDDGDVDQNEEEEGSANKKLKTDPSSASPPSPHQIIQLLAVGVAGQMHGEVMLDEDGRALGDTCRLWCDARNQDQADLLMGLFSRTAGTPIKVPKRMTVARYLWSTTHRSSLQEQCRALTTPAGYVVYKLTGGQQHTIGIGEGSGMFPICPNTKTWREDLLRVYDESYSTSSGKSLSQVLPTVLVAGQIAGMTAASSSSSWWLDDLLPAGIPIAPAEGDQPASLVASLMAQRGQISCSFGTSVVANVIGGGGGGASKSTSDDDGVDPPSAVIQTNPSVDHFMTVTGQPTYMVWLRNGTTWLNHLVETQYGNDWETLMPQLLNAPDDCHGLLSLPFLDDEPGLNVNKGGTAMIIGYRGGVAGDEGQGGEDDESGNSDRKATTQNTLVGSTLKASLLATMFNLKLGTAPLLEQLDDKATTSETSSSSDGVVLTGGLAKTPATGQILANVFNKTVHVPEGAVGQEGCSWGAALLAMHAFQQNKAIADSSGGNQQQEEQQLPTNEDFVAFLSGIQTQAPDGYRYEPQATSVEILEGVLQRYEDLLQLQPSLQKIVQKRK